MRVLKNYKVRAKSYSLLKVSLVMPPSNDAIKDQAGTHIPLFAPECLAVWNSIRCGGKEEIVEDCQSIILMVLSIKCQKQFRK